MFEKTSGVWVSITKKMNWCQEKHIKKGKNKKKVKKGGTCCKGNLNEEKTKGEKLLHVKFMTARVHIFKLINQNPNQV